MTLLKTAGLMAIAASAISPDAFGQDYFTRDRYQAVTDRFQPDFDQEPIRVGSFVASPVLSAGLQYSDNVFAEPDNEREDIVSILGAAVSTTSDWGRHEIGADVGVQHRQYIDFSDESVTTINGILRGRLDVTNDFTFDGSVFAVSSADPRTSEAVAATFAEPVEFTRAGASVQANYVRDRIRLRGYGNVDNTDFDDAVLTPEAALEDPDGGDQSFRANTVTRFGGQAAYAISPDIALYTQAEVFERSFDSLNILFDETLGMERGASRDSEGYRAEVGADFELPLLLRGDIAVGYLEETRDDPAFADFDGLSLDATLSWFPSRLTTVTFASGRRTIDVGLTGTGGALETDFGVRVDHELQRNILLFARGEIQNRQFDDLQLDDGSIREDDTIQAGFGATYKLNKRFHLDAGYNLFDRSSNLDPVEFTRNRFTLTLRVFA
ncbi:MAG: outer membrane beta-barrel protein [Pseudomonadota bacterium]